MIKLTTAKEVEVKKVEARDTVARDEGVGIVVRVHCVFNDLAKLKLVNEQLPIVESVKAAIADSSNVESEGRQPNTTTVRIKRRFKTLEYLFVNGKRQLARFEADVKTVPAVKVVEGVAALEFKVEGTVEPVELGELASVIGNDGIKLKTETPVDPQQDLGL